MYIHEYLGHAQLNQHEAAVFVSFTSVFALNIYYTPNLYSPDKYSTIFHPVRSRRFPEI